jgi:hypothetical protein
MLGAKILSRLLTVNGSSYVNKFATKSGGFVIMRHRLKRWWNIPTIWPICFAILFDRDVAKINFERPFDLFGLLETFDGHGNFKVVYPEAFPVIAAMVQNGLKTIVKIQEDTNSPSQEGLNASNQVTKDSAPLKRHNRPRSMSLNAEVASIRRYLVRSLAINR